MTVENASHGGSHAGRKRFVVAVTGASGAPYAVALLRALRRSDCEVHLTVSPSGAAVVKQELGLTLNLQQPDLAAFLTCRAAWSSERSDEAEVAELGLDSLSEAGDDRLRYHRHDDFMTPIASGSFLTDAMVICPCSGSTLSGVSRSAASNLVQRAAEVHLKEHRKLILVPRETPMSVIQLENLHRVAAAGAVVLPGMPGWYHDVRCLEDLVDFVVARILDQMGMSNDLMKRWGEPEPEASP